MGTFHIRQRNCEVL